MKESFFPGGFSAAALTASMASVLGYAASPLATKRVTLVTLVQSGDAKPEELGEAFKSFFASFNPDSPQDLEELDFLFGQLIHYSIPRQLTYSLFELQRFCVSRLETGSVRLPDMKSLASSLVKWIEVRYQYNQLMGTEFVNEEVELLDRTSALLRKLRASQIIKDDGAQTALAWASATLLQRTDVRSNGDAVQVLLHSLEDNLVTIGAHARQKAPSLFYAGAESRETGASLGEVILSAVRPIILGDKDPKTQAFATDIIEALDKPISCEAAFNAAVGSRFAGLNPIEQLGSSRPRRVAQAAPKKRTSSGKGYGTSLGGKGF